MSTSARKTTSWTRVSLVGMTEEEKKAHTKRKWHESNNRVKARGGTCDCGQPAKVRSADGWACDRCLRMEAAYYGERRERALRRSAEGVLMAFSVVVHQDEASNAPTGTPEPLNEVLSHE
jgi:hypothetical protein